MKRKRQFHCNLCDSPCEIYKRGRSHRVLVCPNCGILATNPLPLAALGLAAKVGGKALKGAGKLVGIKGKEEKAAGEKPAITKHYEYNIDTYTAQERVRDALK